MGRTCKYFKKVCPSLLKWAGYVLGPCADKENKDKSKLNSNNFQKKPLQSFEITDDAIMWKSVVEDEMSSETKTTANMEE